MATQISSSSVLQGTRNYWEQPGGNDSIWNTPLGSGAVWYDNPNDPAVQDIERLEKTAGKRAPPKSVAAAPPSEIKTAQRKPPKKIATEPETRRKAAKR